MDLAIIQDSRALGLAVIIGSSVLSLAIMQDPNALNLVTTSGSSFLSLATMLNPSVLGWQPCLDLVLLPDPRLGLSTMQDPSIWVKKINFFKKLD
jgi:hypothetical protein